VANRRITEFPAIAASEIVDQDVMTLVHVFEVDPSLRNKKDYLFPVQGLSQRVLRAC
jgi:hypothetical protein